MIPDADSVSSAGVVGAGTMGHGIAHVLALAGVDVRLVDVEESALEEALSSIERNLGRQASKGVVDEEDAGAALSRVATGTDTGALEEAEIVVEAVSEDPDVKFGIFHELGETCSRDAVLASNTSSISITDLASRVPRPGRVLGMHFMNPVPVMELVEVVRGLQTDDEVVEFTREMAERLGKTPVTVRDYPGFVSNRVLMPMLNEAMFCVMEGVAEPEAVDEVMTLGMNHPMGPLELADLIGLDTCLSILEVLHRDLGDDKYRPCPLLRKYVSAGWLGRKSGRGFYRYDD
ncbi:MAG: 3-hydroxybutyryl-CoA dehydrogenase [Candidatus Palauibacterales bacterium]|nr:3-hydroxybutyryl-CoA dehydrogenase [Candidatus Palauibacterales bacterium]